MGAEALTDYVEGSLSDLAEITGQCFWIEQMWNRLM
jgi:hypothetical protein